MPVAHIVAQGAVALDNMRSTSMVATICCSLVAAQGAREAIASDRHANVGVLAWRVVDGRLVRVRMGSARWWCAQSVRVCVGGVCVCKLLCMGVVCH